MQANKPEYHKLDADKFLKQQLVGKCVIEFPVLLVLLPEEGLHYQLVNDATQDDQAIHALQT